MKYPWPDLKQKCLLCGGAKCAIYKGYYTRVLFCPEMEVFEKIVIRTAFCKKKGERFSLTPDFTLPRVKVSRLSLAHLQDLFSKSSDLSAVIDSWTEGLGEEFYVPKSTVRNWLSIRIVVPP